MRVITALVVAAMATVASLYLFAAGGRSDSQPAMAISLSDDIPAPAVDESSDGTSGGSVEPSGENVQPAPEPIVIRTTVDRTQSVRDFLLGTGLAPEEAKRWAHLFEGAAHSSMVRRGHQVAIYKDPETSELRGFQYDVDDRLAVETRGLGNGVVMATQQLIKYVVRPVQVAFAVKDGFERAAARNHIPQAIVDRLRDAFGSKQPLEKLRAGAALKLIYEEQVSRDGGHKLVGDLTAAELLVGTRTLSAFSFRDEQGRSHLFDEQGRPLGPRFLRFPLPFEYISSGFSASRYHPILHRYRPHVGVDLVAEYGTPVKAIADGTVEFSDWSGELGRCVRVVHDHGMVSVYAHLSKISPAARPGAPVRIGEIIGWVGSTGLTTGPHLHFALFKRGAYVNPLTAKLEGPHEISPRMRALFGKLKEHYQAALAKLPDLSSHAVSAGDRKPAISKLADMYHVEVRPVARSARSRRRSARAAERALWSAAGGSGGSASDAL